MSSVFSGYFRVYSQQAIDMPDIHGIIYADDLCSFIESQVGPGEYSSYANQA